MSEQLTQEQKQAIWAVKPGWYWATDIVNCRAIVEVDDLGRVWNFGCECEDRLEDWKDYVPVACEESAAALEAFNEHQWPYNLSEDEAKLIETAIAKNRAHFVKDGPGDGEA
jgi:hypothetical protein